MCISPVTKQDCSGEDYLFEDAECCGVENGDVKRSR